MKKIKKNDSFKKAAKNLKKLSYIILVLLLIISPQYVYASYAPKPGGNKTGVKTKAVETSPGTRAKTAVISLANKASIAGKFFVKQAEAAWNFTTGNKSATKLNTKSTRNSLDFGTGTKNNSSSNVQAKAGLPINVAPPKPPKPPKPRIETEAKNSSSSNMQGESGLFIAPPELVKDVNVTKSETTKNENIDQASPVVDAAAINTTTINSPNNKGYRNETSVAMQRNQRWYENQSYAQERGRSGAPNIRYNSGAPNIRRY